MTNRRNPFSRIRLVYKRSRPLTKIMALCAIVLSTATLLALSWMYENTQAQIGARLAQAAQLEQENSRLEDYISGLGSVDSVERIAQEELGLLDPDTLVIQPED